MPDLARIDDLVVDPHAAAVVYLALRVFEASKPGPVFKSTNGGTSWVEASTGLAKPSYDVGRLAADPKQPGVLYFGSSSGIFRSADGGASWQPVNSAPGDQRIQSLTVAASDGSVYAGTSRFSQPWSPGVLRSRDGGQSWQASAAGLPSSFVSSLSPNPLVEGEILAGIERQGIQRSEDGGAHWTASGEGIDEPWIGPLTRDPTAPGTVYTVAGESRLFKAVPEPPRAFP